MVEQNVRLWELAQLDILSKFVLSKVRTWQATFAKAGLEPMLF